MMKAQVKQQLHFEELAGPMNNGAIILKDTVTKASKRKEMPRLLLIVYHMIL